MPQKIHQRHPKTFKCNLLHLQPLFPRQKQSVLHSRSHQGQTRKKFLSNRAPQYLNSHSQRLSTSAEKCRLKRSQQRADHHPETSSQKNINFRFRWNPHSLLWKRLVPSRPQPQHFYIINSSGNQLLHSALRPHLPQKNGKKMGNRHLYS